MGRNDFIIHFRYKIFRPEIHFIHDVGPLRDPRGCINTVLQIFDPVGVEFKNRKEIRLGTAVFIVFDPNGVKYF